MGHPARQLTYDDELHERRRRLAVVRTHEQEPLSFEEARLRRLIERAKDTRDP